MHWSVVIGFAVAGVAFTPVAVVLLRRAGAPVSPRLAVGLVAAAEAVVAWRGLEPGRPGWWLPVPVVLTAFAVPLALADLRHLRLPDVLTLPAYPALGAAIAVAAGGEPAMAARAVAGSVVFGGVHALVHRRAPGSLGGGDVKLAGSLGAVLAAVGWAALVFGAVAAALLSAALATARGFRRAVPHGPALLAAAWLCAVFPGGGGG